MESNHTFLQNDFTDRLSHQWLKHPNFAHSTGIEPASPPSTGSVVTIPLRTKLLLIILGKEYLSQYGYELMYQIAVRYKLSFPFLYLVMVMLHRLLHVKQLRFYYANEAGATPNHN